ncbi:MAG TPA: POTRA domain-containing protein [bacterium]|nr:POTRA domain-containing protein [bacterium]
MRIVTLLLLSLVTLSLCGMTVERVQWKSDLPFDDYRRLIKIETGAPLSQKSVRRTVRLLYATGRFEQIVVSLAAGSTSETALLTVTARPLLFIDDIEIHGNGGLSDNRVKLAGGLRRFSPFYESSLERIREEILFAYRSEGYADAQVSIEVKKDSLSEVDLAISIREGERRQVRSVKLVGQALPSEKRELENELSLANAFAPLTDERVRDMDDRVERYYRDRGHLDAAVRHQLNPDGTVLLTVNRGPRYELAFSGAVAFSGSTLRALINPIENWQHNTEAVTARLTLFYQAAGFPDAAVTAATKRMKKGKQEEISITVTIAEKERRFLDGVVFSGVAAEDPEELKERIFEYVETRLELEEFPPTTLDRTIIGGGYRDTDGTRSTTVARTNKDRAVLPEARYAVPSAYIEDIARHIEALYAAHGCLAAQVSRAAIVRDGDLLYLSVEIAEGPRSMLTWVGVDTGDATLDEELFSELDLAANIPFTPTLVDDAVTRLNALLRERGYLFARIRDDRSVNDTNIRVIFRAEDLFPVTAGELVVSGNAVTAEPVVRSIVRFDPGTRLTTGLLHDARQNILTTGAFDAAEIALIDEEAPNSVKDIVITISEAWRFRIDIGAGVATDEGGRLFGAFEYKNVLGRVFTLRLSYKFAHKIPWFMNSAFEDYFLHDLSFFERFDRTVNGAIIVPDLYFLPFALAMQTEVFHIHDSRSSSGLPYLLDKNGMMVSFYKRFGDHFFLALNTELSRQDEEEYQEIFDQATQAATVAFEHSTRYLLSPEIEGWADYRNSPVSPDRGFKIGLRARNVASLAGDDTKYTLLENYASVYLPLQYRQTASGDYVPRDTLVWHSYLKYAALLHHSGELTAEDTLKLGGSTSVRGFAQNSIIPADNDDGERDGKYYLFLRNEIRFKVQDRLFIVTFFDAGNLWERIENIGQGDLLRYGTGGGIMFASPIGSINLQAGVNLFPKEDRNLDYKEDLWSFHFFISSF